MSKKGFTLLELMIVIVILGIMASLISGNFITSLKKGRDARRKGDFDQIQRALEMYYEDKGLYPTASAGKGFPFGSRLCQTSSCQSSDKVYMQKVPNDPRSGIDYQYASDGTYYQMYACLENTQQILPYVSQSSTISCSTNCKDPNGSSVSCVWGISSQNTNP